MTTTQPGDGGQTGEEEAGVTVVIGPRVPGLNYGIFNLWKLL